MADINLNELPQEDKQALLWLARWKRRMDDWCSINRAIGRFVLITIIGTLILLSSGWDAVVNLVGHVFGHRN